MPNSLTLYELEDNLVALMDTEGCVEDEETRLALLDEIAQATEAAIQKRNGVIRFLRHLDLQIGNVDAEIERLKALKDSYERGKDRVAKYVVRVIEGLPEPKRGTRKLEGSCGVLSIAKNPDKCEITDEAYVPGQYKDVTVTMSASEWFYIEERLDGKVQVKRMATTVRKSDVKADIQRGVVIPGAGIVAGEKRLVVK